MKIKLFENAAEIRNAFINTFVSSLDEFQVKQTDWIAEIMFMRSGLVVIQAGKQSGMHIDRPASRETLDKLVEYLQTNGVKERLSD